MITTMFARTFHRRFSFHHSSISLSNSLRGNNSHSPTNLLRREMSMETERIVDRLKSSGLLQTKGLIGGKWTDAYDGKTIEVNPASGDVIASVACMGERETKDALSSAYDAFTHWSKLTANDRSSRLRNWYNLLLQHKEELGQLITLEQGN